MRQFEIFPNPSERSRAAIPFVVVLQSHLLGAMPTTVVAPILVDDGRSAYTETSVTVEIEGRSYVISVAELLQRSAGDLASYEDAIRRALDRVFTGF